MNPKQLDSGRIAFRPRARLIKVLGEELIRDEVIAVTELVKNSFDADASTVEVKLENITDPSTALIEIRDDGFGMDKKTVLESWLEPGTAYKVPLKKSGRGKRRTPKGRLMLGEKGVGRFALDKLGSSAELVTRAQGSDEEVRVIIRWSDYAGDDYLDEVENAWEVREPEELIDRPHGTIIRVTDIGRGWNEERVEQIHLAVSKLVSPFSGAEDFRVILTSTDYPEFNGKVEIGILDLAPYRLEGQVDDKGLLTCSYQYRYPDDEPEQKAFEVDARKPSRSVPPEIFLEESDGDKKWRSPECGPFRLHMYVWDLYPPDLKRAHMDGAARDILRARSGVSIYRDGFRIWPYGERGEDWLDLNQRRVNNPSLRLSNNQLIGFVEITQEANPDLRDKTNREGFIETEAFTDLEWLVKGSLDLLEQERFKRRQELKRIKRWEDEVVKHIDEIRDKHGDVRRLKSRVDRLARAYDRKRKEHRGEIDRLISLAGIGMAAEALTHELKGMLAAADESTTHAVTTIAAEKGDAHMAVAYLEELRDQLETVRHQVGLIAPFYYSSRRKITMQALEKAVDDVQRLFSGKISKAGIEVKVLVEGKDRPRAKMNRGHLLQVLWNLFDNALYWLTSLPVEEPTILLKISTNGRPVIVFADNGPGVAPEDEDFVFEPFFTRKPEGRGLGLYIVRDILVNYDARIDVLREDCLLPGANFVITFKDSEGA